MTSNTKIWVAIFAVAIIALVGCFAPQTTTVVRETVERVAGITNYDELDVDTLTVGGGITTTSTPGSSVLLVTDIDTEDRVDMTLTQTSGTLTLPASSTMTSIVPNAGDKRKFWVRHATTSSAVTLTIAASTGVSLKNAASSTALLIGDTDGNNMMEVELERLTTGGNIVAKLQKYQD